MTMNNTRTEMTRNEFEFDASQSLMATGYVRNADFEDLFVKNSGPFTAYAEFLPTEGVMVEWVLANRIEGTVDVRVAA